MWCEYYQQEEFIFNGDIEPRETSLKESLAEVATHIHADHKGSYVVFLSGGIDSQSIVLGFLHAGIKPHCVFYRHGYIDDNGLTTNKLEEFYTQSFCDSNGLKLEIIDDIYNRDRLEDIVKRRSYITLKDGIYFKREGLFGSMFLNENINQYSRQHSCKVVTAMGNFVMRTDNGKKIGYTATSSFSKPNSIDSSIEQDSLLIFSLYNSALYGYYMYKHSISPYIQSYKNFEGKNLAFIELGLQFRPKLRGWEFMDRTDHSLSEDVNLGYGVDSGIYTSPFKIICEKLSIDFQRTSKTSNYSREGRLTPVYEI
jgi:hypothetical protein|tara:strand:- start:407 stop:1342 length:936 start_codon:yes stop_codon:yes gene_type:complete